MSAPASGESAPARSPVASLMRPRRRSGDLGSGFGRRYLVWVVDLRPGRRSRVSVQQRVLCLLHPALETSRQPASDVLVSGIARQVGRLVGVEREVVELLEGD